MVIVCFGGLSKHLEAHRHGKRNLFDHPRQCYVVILRSAASKLPWHVEFDLHSLPRRTSTTVWFTLHAQTPSFTGSTAPLSHWIILFCVLCSGPPWFGETMKHMDDDVFFGNCPFVHVRMMMDFPGPTALISSGLSLPVGVYCVQANRLCPVHFRLKLMKWEAFSISMDIVAQWHSSFFWGPALGPKAHKNLLFPLSYIK